MFLLFTLSYFTMDYNSAIFKKFQFDSQLLFFCTIRPFRDPIRVQLHYFGKGWFNWKKDNWSKTSSGLEI
jgi:hypothetical protein